MNGEPRTHHGALLAGAAAIMPVVASAWPTMPVEAAQPRLFSPPATAMVLTRVLKRPLPGGAEVRTRRSYEIRFVSEESGYRIDGELVETVVDAPPALQALAALERNRPDEGMFPMRLDANGRLIPNSETPPAGQEVREAGKLALETIASIGISASEAKAATDFVKQVKKQTGRTPWPEDLFNPAPGQRQQVQTIPLPNGAQGHVSVEIEAQTDGPSGLLASFARTVTTELGGDARVTQEIWTLSGKT